MTSMKKKIFVGGTGRSGTTILARILGNHENIFSLPHESRFITDPDGLISLYRSFFPEWSFFQTDKAMSRFVDLMNNLRGKFKGDKYPLFGFESHMNEGAYQSSIDSYLTDLGVEKFKSAWAGRIGLFQFFIARFLNDFKISRFMLEDSYYTSPVSEEEFVQLTNRFLNEYFDNWRSAKNNEIIVDHTPSNALHAQMIHKFLPDAKFLIIYRNPLDIICSFKTKGWASNEQNINEKWIFDSIKQWNNLKKELPKDLFLEVKFEELITNSEKVLREICSFIGVEYNSSLLELDLSKHNIDRWKKNLSRKDVDRITEEYQTIFSEWKYL